MTIRPVGWLVILLTCAAGFAALVTIPALVSGAGGRWLSVLLFAGLPLLALRGAARGHWAALLQRPTWRDVEVGVAFAPLTLLVSAAVALLVSRTSLTAVNPSAGLFMTLSGLDLASFWASTAPQLLGEEVVTILPFLAVLALLHAKGVPRGPALAAATLFSALVFGALHLSTYDWHVEQALLVIGSSRLVLTASYLLTKNLWTSVIAHITNDWSIFALLIVARIHGVA